MLKIHLFSLLLATILLPSCNNELPENEPVNHTLKEIKFSTDIIIDSDVSFDETVSGIEIPKNILKQLRLIDVKYYSLDNKLHQGQILTNKDAANDLLEIFELIERSQFPIGKVIPISEYGWSDEKSMLDNNTSCFNYREVKGQKVLSPHAYGLAIDINPLLNPHIKRNKSIPLGASYDSSISGTLSKNSFLVTEFKKRGWKWGGDWTSSKDYQHFEKTMKNPQMTY